MLRTSTRLCLRSSSSTLVSPKQEDSHAKSILSLKSSTEMFVYWHATAPKAWEMSFQAPSCGKPLFARSAQEAKRLCGSALSIYPYHGGHRKKDPAFLAEFDIVVTTYGIVQVPFVVFRSSWRLWLGGTISSVSRYTSSGHVYIGTLCLRGNLSC